MMNHHTIIQFMRYITDVYLTLFDTEESSMGFLGRHLELHATCFDMSD
jgi:hypothetical protein